MRASYGPCTALGAALAACLLCGPVAFAGVVISEIHYNPLEGGTLEFVELHNSGPQIVSIGGWSFSDGIGFDFPPDASIAPDGFVIVCKDRSSALEYFGLPTENVFGNFGGSLDNSGERLVLEDSGGAVIDEVRYDDGGLWDAAANGGGPSLQRFCDSFFASNGANWSAEAGTLPTPLAAFDRAQCPPPELPPPPIAINEIHYHPLGETDADEEFVELVNNGDEVVNLFGYTFSAGIRFTFVSDFMVEPGGYAVVCRNARHLAEVYGLQNAVGDFEGQLSNAGERLTLIDPFGAVVDSVRYSDSGDWPVAPDGLGHSLERVLPTSLSDDPASWAVSVEGPPDGEWHSVSVFGQATSSTRLYVYLEDVGETILDNFVLEREDSPGVNIAQNGSFDTGIEGWEIRGNHLAAEGFEGTVWSSDGGPDGSGALLIRSNGRGTGRSNGMTVLLTEDLVRNDPIYACSFDYRRVGGTEKLKVRISGSTQSRGVYWTYGTDSTVSPGKPNGALSDARPPHVDQIAREPREPGSQDTTWITARVRADRDIEEVTFLYSIDDGAEESPLPMLDDGAHGDGAAGDGVYGVGIAPLPHNTIVKYRIRARDVSGAETLSPHPANPTAVHGYYVNDYKPDSPLPIFNILYQHTSPADVRTLMRSLPTQCNEAGYRPCSFAFRGDLFPDVEIRRRGGSVCGASKPYMKLRFRQGREFQGQHKVNLQSLWTDKALIRDKLAWDAFRDLGFPSLQEEFIRIHVNGKYFGLYATLEQPDKRFLERVKIDPVGEPTGNLYKATASREEANGTYEKKTNEEDPGMTDLRSFLNDMHASFPGPASQVAEFFESRMDADSVIDYQTGQVLINNHDYPHKNHYLYHQPEPDRWMVLLWDLDLCFGKTWDGNNSGVYHDRLEKPGINPWYTTRVQGSRGNWLLDGFFFEAGTWFRRAYLTRLYDALHEKYTEEFYLDKIAGLRDLLMEDQEEDIAFWGRTPPSNDDRTAPAEFLPNLDRIMEHLQSRRSYLMNFLRASAGFEGHDRLKVTELNYNPLGRAEDLEFLELWNSTGRAIDIGGWTIAGIGFTFEEGSTAEENEVLIVAKNPELFRAEYETTARVYGPYEGNLDNNGETLRVKDAGPEYPATVDIVKYDVDGDWPRDANGLGYSLELTSVSPDRDNDMGYNWKASDEPGGSPGRIPGITGENYFRRGDANGDGRVNIVDAVDVLRHLFRGETGQPCKASLDVDASDAIDTTDAVVLIGYIFGLLDRPIPSPGPRECMATSSALCEQSICEP